MAYFTRNLEPKDYYLAMMPEDEFGAVSLRVIKARAGFRPRARYEETKI
jgi:hypothetical protein